MQLSWSLRLECPWLDLDGASLSTSAPLSKAGSHLWRCSLKSQLYKKMPGFSEKGQLPSLPAHLISALSEAEWV